MQHFPHLIKSPSITIHDLACRLRQPLSQSLHTPLPAPSNVQEVKVVSPFYARTCTRVNCVCPFHRRTRLGRLDCYAKHGSFKVRYTKGKENQWEGKVKYAEELEQFMHLYEELINGRDGQDSSGSATKQKSHGKSDTNSHMVRTAAKDIFDYIFTHLNANQQMMQRHINSIQQDRDLADFYLMRFAEIKKKIQAARLDCPNDKYNGKMNDKLNGKSSDKFSERLYKKGQSKQSGKSRRKSGYKSNSYLKQRQKQSSKPTAPAVSKVLKQKSKYRKVIKKRREGGVREAGARGGKSGDGEKMLLMRRMIEEMGGVEGVKQSRLREFIELELGIYRTNIRGLQQDISQNKYERMELEAINNNVLGRVMAMIVRSPPKEEEEKKKTILEDAIIDLNCHLEEQEEDMSEMESEMGSAASIRLRKTKRRDSRRSSFLKQIQVIGEDQKNYLNGSAQRKQPNWKRNERQESLVSPAPRVEDTPLTEESQKEAGVHPVRDSEQTGPQEIQFQSKLTYLHLKEGHREARIKVLERCLLENNMGQLLVKRGDCLITTNRKCFTLKLLLDGHMRVDLRENIKEYLLLVEELNYLKHPIWARYRLRKAAATRYCRLSPAQDPPNQEANMDIQDLLRDFKHLNNTLYDLKVAISPEEDIILTYRRCVLAPQLHDSNEDGPMQERKEERKEGRGEERKEKSEKNPMQKWGLKQVGFAERQEQEERVSVYVSPVKKKCKQRRGS